MQRGKEPPRPLAFALAVLPLRVHVPVDAALAPREVRDLFMLGKRQL